MYMSTYGDFCEGWFPSNFPFQPFYFSIYYVHKMMWTRADYIFVQRALFYAELKWFGSVLLFCISFHSAFVYVFYYRHWFEKSENAEHQPFQPLCSIRFDVLVCLKVRCCRSHLHKVCHILRPIQWYWSRENEWVRESQQHCIHI